MQSFLDKLANEILNEHGDNISGLCIVFPSRRAGIYFKKYLAEKLRIPIWAPSVYSIEDFVQELSPYIIADKLVLIFELYEVYKIHGEQESFDRFYPWSEMLLNDFDEADKNLINGEKLFKIIKELKQIEEEFQYSAGDLEEFRRFWKTFSDRELNDLQKEFIKTWEIIGKVYADFKKRLEQKKICYTGMAYRKLYEDLKAKKIEIKWNKVIFAGFNFLTTSEAGIIKELLKIDKALLYWDTDEYYINDNEQEAGKYLRDNFKNLGITSPNWVENNFLDDGEKKTINVTGAPLQIGQAKALGDALSELCKKHGFKPENSAIVLPEENMLLPVLYTIPSEIQTMNVTMGFPFRNTPLYNLIELLGNLHRHKKPGKNEPVFYHRDVIEILMHPYVKYSSPAYIYSKVEEIKKNNIIYLSPKRIAEDSYPAELLTYIFKDVKSLDEVFDYLYKILDMISSRLEVENGNGTVINKFELEYFFNLYEQLNHIKEASTAYTSDMTIDTFWRMVTEVLRSLKIPFTGEPLKGMQIMGMLETRTLDFENVFILSMNEGVIPSGKRYSSFIPYSLRKGFHLPTYEDEDSIPAYYFYRLLQRAKNVYLFYDTEVEAPSAGEMSRFLLQVENELAKSNKNIKYTHYIAETEARSSTGKDIMVSKTPELLQKLKDTEYLTPSNLIDYINCTLQFYLKKIAGIEEEETVEEFFSPATLGNIVHKIIQILYSDYKGNVITTKIIELIKQRLNTDFDNITYSVFRSIEGLKEIKELQGKNLLLKGVIKRLINNILENDSSDTPFKLVDTERRVERFIELNIEGKAIKIKISGRIDRIDERNGVSTIIDYKTGNVQFKEGNKMDSTDYFNSIFSDPEYKENFQAYCYAYLYLNDKPGKKVNIAIYPLRKISEGLRFLNDDGFPENDLTLFGIRLQKLVEEIFDPSVQFTKTADVEHCKYCAYKSLCYRE
jgi:CRISPR/Cas system-associated exonuclease Cas4 (RecB family)